MSTSGQPEDSMGMFQRRSFSDVFHQYDGQRCRSVLEESNFTYPIPRGTVSAWYREGFPTRRGGLGISVHGGSDADDDLDGVVSYGAQPHISESPLLSIAPFGTIASLDQIDGYILRYYDRVVCSNASLLDDPANNPARYVFLPLASSSPTILRAILAVGVGKLAHREPR
ncbi:hypothetical protein PV05_04875 [Exophiala xenobiotica]|uniref:Uncharacterized protein n=1 Tax=Exophiala xenobiotica TaxID=348802 RepID=A0A0D2D1A0_9EURO|nr:uncharacterized protein PV05_04875 [Exophiala xenobiotica]KIW56197.1 hypothetical protein PV05_04875 [Exophiala xenobiotica]